MQIGRWRVDIVNAGNFRLDGGAMFGAVPKILWNRLMPADEENRIFMATNCLLLRDGVHVVLVDAGNGSKEDTRWRERFALEPEILLEGLGSLGVGPEDVTHALISHLHFDHAGGFTRLDDQGRAVPTFPKARHLVQARELDMARHPHLRVAASYVPLNWEPLEAAGLLETVEGPVECLPELWLKPLPGHVPGLQGIFLGNGEVPALVYPSDLIPTASHIHPAFAMGYDLDVVTCVDQRVALLEAIAGTPCVVVFEHDPSVPAGRVVRDAKGRYAVEPVTDAR